jgi:hypothetical protein
VKVRGVSVRVLPLEAIVSVSFATVSSSGASVRTYHHLVDTVLYLSRVAANDSGEPPFVWARVAPPGRTDGALERAGRQTPYAAQTIGEGARVSRGGAAGLKA